MRHCRKATDKGTEKGSFRTSSFEKNYYVHSLGYRPDFIGVFSAMPAVGALIGSRISPFVVLWQQVDPCTILKYSRYE